MTLNHDALRKIISLRWIHEKICWLELLALVFPPFRLFRCCFIHYLPNMATVDSPVPGTMTQAYKCNFNLL